MAVFAAAGAVLLAAAAVSFLYSRKRGEEM